MEFMQIEIPGEIINFYYPRRLNNLYALYCIDLRRN